MPPKSVQKSGSKTISRTPKKSGQKSATKSPKQALMKSPKSTMKSSPSSMGKKSSSAMKSSVTMGKASSSPMKGAASSSTRSSKKSSSSSSSSKKRLNPYEILNLERSATASDIKKAYYVLARRLHPDKQAQHLQQDPDVLRSFQILQLSYEVLSDKKQRENYDKYGIIEGLDDQGDDTNIFGEGNSSEQGLSFLFGKGFRKVESEDIDSFIANYKGSLEERNDLQELYKKAEEGILSVFTDIIGAEPSVDLERYCRIFKEFDDEEEKRKKVFTPALEKKLRKKAVTYQKQLDREEKAGEAYLSAKAKSNELVLLIQNRNSGRHINPNGALAQAMREAGEL